MENRRLIIVICAAVVLCLGGALSPLIWLYVVRPQFEADDARMRIVFQADLDSANDQDVLESVRRAIERRLQHSQIVPVFLVQAAGDDRIEVLTPEITQEQLEQIRKLVTRPGTLEFALLANRVDHTEQIAAATSDESTGDDDSVAWVPVAAESDVRDDGGRYDVFRETEQGVREFLIVRDPPGMRITGNHLESARVGIAPNRTVALDFQFDHRGAFLMQRLTAANAPRPGAGYKNRLAIILDGRIHSAPTINEMIAGRGQITGDFTEDEVRQFAAALMAGKLPAPVEFVESEVVGEGVE